MAITKSIMAAARDQFIARGVEGAVMDTIAANAGITRSALYARYTTKEALFDAVAVDFFARWGLARAFKRLPKGSKPQSILRNECRNIAMLFASNEWREHQALLRAAGPQLLHYREKSNEGYLQLVVDLAADIAPALPENGSPNGPKNAAKIIVMALYGWWQLEQGVRAISKGEALAFADQLAELVSVASR